MKNVLKTYLFIGILTAFLLIFGNMLAGRAGVMIALFFSLIFNIAAFWFSDKIILTMYKAKEIGRGDYSGLFEIVEKLAVRAGLPMPKVYIVPNSAPNAFATGRSPKRAAIAATEGLIQSLSHEEIEGVMAHELSHIKRRDTLISTITAVIASSIMHITALARWGFIFGIGRGSSNRSGGLLGTILMIVLAPIVALLIQAAVSRSREFLADSGAKDLTGNGIALSNALRKIENMVHRGMSLNVSPETAHMFIINPITAKSLLSLFSTHPSTDERIRKLLYGV